MRLIMSMLLTFLALLAGVEFDQPGGGQHMLGALPQCQAVTVAGHAVHQLDETAQG